MASFRIERAVKLAATHPAVRSTRVVAATGEGDVTVEFDLETALPAAWRLAGESPSGVREIEPVRFAFPTDYPLHAPRITLRPDFNRSHPHINPGSPLDPPSPCIVAGSPRELVQSRGIEALVDQMASWLDKASTAALNDPAQGWEPVRRDNLDDIMVVDGGGIRSFANAVGGGSVLVQTSYALVDEPGMRIYGIDHRSCVPLELAKATSSRGSLTPTRHVGASLGMVFWAPERSPGEPFVVSHYAPETVSTVRDLRERAKTYGCQAQFDGLFNRLAVGIHQRKVVATPLAITFLVRRPFDVTGTGSPIELCSYVIHVTSSEDLIQEDRPIVRLCGVREQLSVEILRRVSGEKPETSRTPWTLLGCGSVGSKIAVHMARRGRGPSLLVDHGLMEPHNFGRHALLPTPESLRGTGGFKTHLLADALEQLQQKPETEIGDAVDLIASAERRRRVEALDGLLNTTASTVVREHVAFVDWAERPTIGEAHLLGSGRAGYAAFEGDGGNPNLSDLAAESYRLIADDPELRRVVFDARAEEILIGQGCSAVTFPMPDDRLSALTGGLAQSVAMRQAAARGALGEIRIGKLGADGLSQAWTCHVIEPWTIVRTAGDVEVRISVRVDRLIRDEIARRPGTETGGVIVGRFSHIGNAFQVVDVLPAPSDSTFSAEKFILGTIGLKAAIRKLERETGGALGVLGTWHSHLVASGPSGLDVATAAKLALRQFLPVLLLIALPEGYTGLVAETFDVEALDGRDEGAPV